MSNQSLFLHQYNVSLVSLVSLDNASQISAHNRSWYMDPRNHYTPFQLTSLRIFLLLLTIVGLTGNILVVSVILSRRRWRFANSMFVGNIAIADLFICGFTLPIMINAMFKLEWTLPDTFCNLSGFLDNTAYACSAWSLALGSVERFFLVVFPMRHHQLIKWQTAVCLSVIIWFFSVVIGILPVLGWNHYLYSPLTFSCSIDATAKGIHFYYFAVFLLCVLPGPLIVSTFCYGYIFFYLRSTVWKSPKRRKKNIKVVLPMIVISLTFLACLLPTVIVCTDILINPSPPIQPRLKMLHYTIIHILLLGNSCINPLIFTLCSGKFRQAVFGVIKSIFDHIILFTFYAGYILYYNLKRFHQFLGSVFLIFFSTLEETWELCMRGLRKMRLRKYDSLNDIVIKITLTNSIDHNREITECLQNGENKRHDAIEFESFFKFENNSKTSETVV